jgi:hypothetical protein
MIAYLPSDWIVDEHSEDVFACALLVGVEYPNLIKSNNSQRIEFPSERPKSLALGSGASPFGSRMPKENPVDFISAEAN